MWQIPYIYAALRFYPERKDLIIASLERDARFLRDHECLDYSLLIGVYDPKESKTNLAANRNMGFVNAYT
jgi:hypothetical protein